MELSKDEYTLVPNEKMEAYKIALSVLGDNAVYIEKSFNGRPEYMIISNTEAYNKVRRTISNCRSNERNALLKQGEAEGKVKDLIMEIDNLKRKVKSLKLWKIAAWIGAISSVIQLINLLMLWN